MLDLVKSVSLENLANQRTAVAERLRTALTLIDEAKTIAEAGNLGFPDLRQHMSYRTDHSITDGLADNLTRMLNIVDAGGWRFLMAESGLRTFMDAETRKRWDDDLEKSTIPELTPENIAATFRALYDHRGMMFEDGVVKCFKSLSWHYKTNLPQKFGKRFILTHLSYPFGVNHHSCDKLDDLVRIFHVLDGKPEPDHRQGMYSILGSGFREQSDWPKTLETEYIAIRIFKNGNGHITFKRSELVDHLNRMIGRRYPGALPEPR